MTESSFLDEVALIAGSAAVSAPGAGFTSIDALRNAAAAAAAAAGAGPAVIATGIPACVGTVAPADTASLAAIMRLCTEQQWPVWPIGAGTWQPALPAGRNEDARFTDGPTSSQPPLVVTTTALTAVFEHEPADLVVGVQAGMPLTALHEQLAAADQRLPLDPPAARGATIGATIALGCAGPLRARYGLPRDMALGIEVVTGDGRVLRFGGRVVKNVAGYDGVRMFTGSGGALGIITAAFLRVRSIPRADRTWSIAAPAAGQAAEFALALRAALEPDALELISPSLAADVGLDAAWSVLVRVAGSEDAVGAAESGVADVAARAGFTAVDATGLSIWDRLAAGEASAEPHVVLHVGVPNMAAALATIDRNLASDNDSGQISAGRWRAAAHAADGIIRIWSASLGQLGSDLGADLNVARPASGGPAAAIARRLAASFDPAGVLLPGRVLRESAR